MDQTWIQNFGNGQSILTLNPAPSRLRDDLSHAVVPHNTQPDIHSLALHRHFPVVLPGSQASPLQCVSLADSCLALGASTCRRSREIVEDLAALGALGPSARGARVIYAQTDSLFILFPDASVPEAFDLGQRVAALVSGALPPEINLVMERVFCPFMLLHVNRYAGRSLQGAEGGGGAGSLVAKGVKSMWRQAAPVVSRTLQVLLFHFFSPMCICSKQPLGS